MSRLYVSGNNVPVQSVAADVVEGGFLILLSEVIVEGVVAVEEALVRFESSQKKRCCTVRKGAHLQFGPSSSSIERLKAFRMVSGGPPMVPDITHKSTPKYAV